RAFWGFWGLGWALAGINNLPFSFPRPLASPTEAADGNATLGGGTGTMGLSARYGPQFTLQHVPDYRQNVYIPGSTATLTNAGKRDAKSAGSSGGNKKKSGKKEKK
ncbi:PREDICTED: protocadherin gamma-B4-like, partial [Leptosomus discolor]|uniref:protocadherin gamma-B4-like n=1 Tax=Leptosomus discolor TaxID=188344 RepID=UPI000522AC3D